MLRYSKRLLVNLRLVPYPRRRLTKKIYLFINKLISEKVVTKEEVAHAHTIKLQIEDDPEKRLRSIQSLAETRSEGAIVALVKETVSVTGSWPAEGCVTWGRALLELLRDQLGAENLIQAISPAEQVEEPPEA